jgi:hypothetical protein
MFGLKLKFWFPNHVTTNLGYTICFSWKILNVMLLLSYLGAEEKIGKISNFCLAFWLIY